MSAEGRWRISGSAAGSESQCMRMQIERRLARTSSTIQENDYATGGARGVRCDATKFSALKSSSVELRRAIWCAAGIKTPGECARAGACSTWQTWQVVSGPLE